MGILKQITFMNSEKTDLEKVKAGITFKMHPFMEARILDGSTGRLTTTTGR